MDKYVVSRELAEKLFDAGYIQTSTEFMYWHRRGNNKDVWYVKSSRNWHEHSEAFDHVAAPLSDELLEQLPVSVPDGQADNFFIMQRGRSGIFVGYPNSQGVTSLSKFNPLDHDKPADALAELWLWCKQEGHL
jgi:hypothetical protein